MTNHRVKVLKSCGGDLLLGDLERVEAVELRRWFEIGIRAGQFRLTTQWRKDLRELIGDDCAEAFRLGISIGGRL